MTSFANLIRKTRNSASHEFFFGTSGRIVTHDIVHEGTVRCPSVSDYAAAFSATPAGRACGKISLSGMSFAVSPNRLPLCFTLSFLSVSPSLMSLYNGKGV